ncbi:MAG: biopolymer transporter ExbD [Deltaproteobacteria bacterium]|nr:biopolymer transporter ExbD [Deltaproteobacteria bacterium]
MPHFSPAQRAYIRKHGKQHDLDPSEAVGELNIVPFLDIVVNIIMFLLATVAYILATVQIDSNAPPIAQAGRRPQPNQEQSTLNLTVTVGNDGIFVAGSGATMAPRCMGPAPLGTRSPTIPKRMLDVVREGQMRRMMTYDWAALTDCVARIKNEFPDETQVIVSADPVVEYEHLVAAMDALRNQGQRRLFGDVLISAGVR